MARRMNSRGDAKESGPKKESEVQGEELNASNEEYEKIDWEELGRQYAEKRKKQISDISAKACRLPGDDKVLEALENGELWKLFLVDGDRELVTRIHETWDVVFRICRYLEHQPSGKTKIEFRVSEEGLYEKYEVPESLLDSDFFHWEIIMNGLPIFEKIAFKCRCIPNATFSEIYSMVLDAEPRDYAELLRYLEGVMHVQEVQGIAFMQLGRAATKGELDNFKFYDWTESEWERLKAMHAEIDRRIGALERPVEPVSKDKGKEPESTSSKVGVKKEYVEAATEEWRRLHALLAHGLTEDLLPEKFRGLAGCPILGRSVSFEEFALLCNGNSEIEPVGWNLEETALPYFCEELRRRKKITASAAKPQWIQRVFKKDYKRQSAKSTSPRQKEVVDAILKAAFGERP